MTSSQNNPIITICAYDHPSQIGGTTTWLRSLLPRLRDLQIEAKVLLMRHVGNEGATEKFLQQNDFQVTSCLNPPTTEERASWILKQISEQPTPIFFPNEVLAGYYLIPNLKPAGIKTVGILHSDCDVCSALQDLFVFGEKASKLDTVVCVSEILRSQVISRHPQDCTVEKIPCGVEVPSFVRFRLSKKLRIVYMGRLAEEAKQISRLTRSLCEITRQIPNTEAVIYGDGPSRQSVLNILESDGKGLPVSYGGLVAPDQIYSTLREYDALILLSDYEGLPVCVMEAMASGVVPICLNIRSGVPELITHNQNGILVEDCSTNLIQSVRTLQSNLQLWEDLSKAARKNAEENWSAESCASKWQKTLKKLIENSPSEILKPAKQIVLPPVHHFLESSDPRQSSLNTKPSISLRARRFLSNLKNRLTGPSSGKTANRK